MKQCPKCKNTIELNAERCSNCGYEFDENESCTWGENIDDILEGKNEETNPLEDGNIDEEIAVKYKQDGDEVKEEVIDEKIVQAVEMQTNVKKKISLPVIIACGAVALIVLLFATGIICIHEWTEATCTEAKICSKCNKVKGSALGHEWIEATCTEAKKCQRCNITEGEALGHIKEREIVVSKGSILEASVIAQVCSVCGEKYGQKSVTIKPDVDGEHFNFTHGEFVEYINDTLGNGYNIDNGSDSEEMYIYGFYKNGVYQNNKVAFTWDDSGNVQTIWIMGDMAIALMTHMAMKFDSTLNSDDFIYDIYTNQIVENDGIQYGYLSNESGDDVCIIKPQGVYID